MERPWDAGVQNERTRLAWQRTTLSVLGCLLLIARLVADVSTTLALLIVLAGVVTTASLGLLSIRRYRRTHSSLHANRLIGDGWQNLLVTVLVVLAAAGGLAYVVAG
ncbi:hypothetical protein GCM10009841_00580 [Microlunatus panaciterrae]|uniref:Uncharacterized membrane protein YidH (DUF202 family) n=1 Tax=Microlunatus panaciterrae TaxID=400768 RepID=A0ABS2RLH6_9ACTN|nr:DUF202 domain-containing protein [Microlunatus panaciterrae]MBM7799342.1 uncharacterized membrane protein YidH (DUF202 family) [Microlunatus panaciterrae]